MSILFIHHCVLALLLAVNSGDGTYLLRARDEANSAGCVLGVIYKGKPTHHAVAPGGPGQPMTINNKPCGTATTLAEVSLNLCRPGRQ